MQIGNAITEKMVLDVLLQARDRGSVSTPSPIAAPAASASAVGEMGEEIGAEVWLDQAPLKYDGLSYTEIWISRSPGADGPRRAAENWPRARSAVPTARTSRPRSSAASCRPAGCELKYRRRSRSADLDMQFLHDGRPPVVRKATYDAAGVQSPDRRTSAEHRQRSTSTTILLQDPRLAQRLQQGMDHSPVRSRSAGRQRHQAAGRRARTTGPSDAAVIRPVLGSRRGLAIGCGMNPRYGDLDPYHMAACAIDEAVRNCVAVGADPQRIAILDNFCWGNTDRPETLGSLVRAAEACRDVALAFGTPFISGKDSLNNEFSYERQRRAADDSNSAIRC